MPRIYADSRFIPLSPSQLAGKKVGSEHYRHEIEGKDAPQAFTTAKRFPRVHGLAKASRRRATVSNLPTRVRLIRLHGLLKRNSPARNDTAPRKKRFRQGRWQAKNGVRRGKIWCGRRDLNP